MKELELNIENQPVYIISPNYNKLDELEYMISDLKSNPIIIFMGGVFKNDKNFLNFKKLLTENSYYITSHHDLNYFKKYNLDINKSDNINWIEDQCLYISLGFMNGSRFFICFGGVLPTHIDYKNLKSNFDLSIISTIDKDKKIPWHIKYQGIFGFIVSNYPENDNIISTYNYSASIGVKNKTVIQEINSVGLPKPIYLE